MPMRALTDAETEDTLRSQRVVRIGFQGEEGPYLVPVGYVWFESAIWIATTEGRKTAMARANPVVSFQVDDERDSGFFLWKSVSGVGVWDAVTDPEVSGRVQPHARDG